MTPASRSESRSGAPPVPSATVAMKGRFALKRVPSSRLTITDGITMLGSAPPIPIGGPATLFTITTVAAPASWARLIFATNVHDPRSISAIFPDGFARKGSNGCPDWYAGSQPRPTYTTSPVMGPVVTRLSPKPAMGP